MPKCPACGTNITELHNDQLVWRRYSMGISKIRLKNSIRFKPNYVELKTWPADESVFACPECDAELFNSEDKAIAFLKKK